VVWCVVCGQAQCGRLFVLLFCYVFCRALLCGLEGEFSGCAFLSSSLSFGDWQLGALGGGDPKNPNSG
jgi:hypothetical protein